MCATFSNRFKFLLHDIYLSKSPAWKIASTYKKQTNKESVQPGLILKRTKMFVSEIKCLTLQFSQINLVGCSNLFWYLILCCNVIEAVV